MKGVRCNIDRYRLEKETHQGLQQRLLTMERLTSLASINKMCNHRWVSTYRQPISFKLAQVRCFQIRPKRQVVVRTILLIFLGKIDSEMLVLGSPKRERLKLRKEMAWTQTEPPWRWKRRKYLRAVNRAMIILKRLEIWSIRFTTRQLWHQLWHHQAIHRCRAHQWRSVSSKRLPRPAVPWSTSKSMLLRRIRKPYSPKTTVPVSTCSIYRVPHKSQ